VPVAECHIRQIAAVMRERERNRVLALGGDAAALIAHEVATSFFCYAGLIGDEVLALGGVKCDDLFADQAYAWLLCSDRVTQFPIAFTRAVIEVKQQALARFDTVWALVAADFPASLRWLKRIGFTVEDAEGGFHRAWCGKPPGS
jgi:hypothetical protein